MGKKWMILTGIRVAAIVLLVLSISVSGFANEYRNIDKDNLVTVDYDGVVRYTLDTGTIKRYTGLSGNTLVDVWLEGHPANTAARSRIKAFLDGYLPGVDYDKIGTFRYRFLYKIGGRYSAQQAMAVIIEKQLLDLNGAVSYREQRKLPGSLNEWHDLNETEEKALQTIMKRPEFKAVQQLDPALRNSEVVTDLNAGFLGQPWGIRPGEIKGARHIADIGRNLTVYTADLSLAHVLGDIDAYCSPQLIFEDGSGLVKAHIAFNAKKYGEVCDRLNELLGEPEPIIYEKRTAQVDFSERSEWLVGKNTRVVVLSMVLGAYIEISKQDADLPDGREYEKMLATYQLKQAKKYERQKRFVEAAGIYQGLLNSTVAYRFFTREAQERLAVYSRSDEAAVYLTKDNGSVFYGLKNNFSDNSGQLWIRIDLGPEARMELQKHRPGNIRPQERLKNINAVLCRVKPVPVASRYKVIEQIWLDSSDQIIGGRPAWAQQDSVWPAPYITNACEKFLQAWFNVESIKVQVTKDK